ncbi:MAG: HU family DNA-binding protein [Ignavibacteria bacterium]|jgi:nucleoid DNA-binding protein|nr:HU family DNA-binding protein [Ignavibacteria bacterium]
MSQEELINMISERAGISKQTVREIITTMADVWNEEILSKGELELENIGEFLIEHRPGRKGVNTETKEVFIIPPKDYLAFTASRELIEWSNKTA